MQRELNWTWAWKMWLVFALLFAVVSALLVGRGYPAQLLLAGLMFMPFGNSS